MIKSKEDLKFYLKCDEIARFEKHVSLIEKTRYGCMWYFNVVLRRLEYFTNCKNGIYGKIRCFFLKIAKKFLEQLTGWYIPVNSFGPGLCIVHKGPVIVNPNSKFGSNVRINAMVNIGASKGEKNSPCGGNMIYIGPGAIIFGDIKLGSNIAIGANAVVNKSFEESNITIVGVPARIVSSNGCTGYVINVMDYIKR